MSEGFFFFFQSEGRVDGNVHGSRLMISGARDEYWGDLFVYILFFLLLC